MTLACEPLEPRDCPATWYGGELFVAGCSVRPFEGWSGELNTLETRDVLYVAPGSGGGPRVAVFDRATGERTQPDYFAADPADRNGVVFVGVPQTAIGPPIPANAGDPDGWPVFLDFERGVDHLAFHAAADLLTPAGLFLTTVRPDLPPGSYGTVVVAPLGWADGAAGVTTQDWRQGGDYLPKAVYVDADLSGPWLGKVVAHEVGHAFGLAHRADGTVMGEGFRPGVAWHPADRAALAAGVAR